MSTRGVWGAFLAVVVSASVAGAQSLGELAAKEKERREKERQKRGGASKVVTEEDLRGGGRGTMSNPGATPADTPAEGAEKPAEGAAPADGTAPADPSKPAEAKPAAPKEKTEDEIQAEQQNDWRTRLQTARDQVTELTDRVNRLQTNLNDISGPLYDATRNAMMEQWETAKRELAAAQQSVNDLEEEGRRRRFR
jgi:hypothetical protein